MSDPASPQFHIDRPTDWRPADAAIEITGWLYPGATARCVDLRARVDGRVHLGIYGLERPDIAQAFGGAPAALPTGFIVRVELWRGARELALDWHDGTQWREFFRPPLDSLGLPADAAQPPLVLPAAVVPQTLHYLYRHFHRASWGELCRETDAALAEILTPNSDVATGDGFFGHIENPGFWVNVTYAKFRVTGWIFAVDRAITQLNATSGDLTENRLVYPKDRPDVASHRTDHAGALKSGFYGLVDIRPDTPSPANLLVRAQTSDGGNAVAFSRRLYLDRRDEHSGAVPIFKPFLF
jgi:O-antigen biosynthesis protein